jgi:hypothetical protein
MTLLALSPIVLLAALFAPQTDAPITGIWSGGIGEIGGDQPHWDFLVVEVEEVNGSSWLGTAHFRRENPRIKGKNRDGRVELSFSHGGRRYSLKGAINGNALQGECSHGRSRDSFVLVKEDFPPEEQASQCVGLYEVAPDHHLIVRQSRHLILSDLKGGLVRVLYAQGGDRYGAGPTVGMPLPVETTLTFQRAPHGEVTGLVMDSGQGQVTARRLPGPREEAFDFDSGDVTLRGTLSLPSDEGVHPAVVWVHGSGQASRRGAGSWPMYFAQKGFALLAVDKRGVGESDGTYELPDGGHDNLPHMQRRSGDVRAAVEALRDHPEIDADNIGLAGASQAGWVIPMATAKGGIAFSIILSGGATNLSLENSFSEWARESETGASIPAIDEVLTELRKLKPRDPDFRKYFSAMDCPSLWLYGARDRSNPSQLCIELIEGIAAEEDKDFTICSFPEGNHSLMKCRFGGSAEYGALDRFVPGLHDSIADWLRTKKIGPVEPVPRTG